MTARACNTARGTNKSFYAPNTKCYYPADAIRRFRDPVEGWCIGVTDKNVDANWTHEQRLTRMREDTRIINNWLARYGDGDPESDSDPDEE
ncbi:hypothetical protein AMATHDRAFT_65549 [Amanita thiersii Skay4041]|uniref:Uncharacterized protein n=1 Tax=Amanita thiersii Skay4041 TaxID=703135 RepID=A0A2A9NEF7_9AGAR|nr:hypothetical protein AMATHDRAFT_65549 [Amanita thiersii Skay4041]